MISTIEDFFAAAKPFVTELDTFTSPLFSPTDVQYDHICYKCSSSETFVAIRTLFEHESAFMYQSIISGRRIAYIRFHTPLPSAFGDIQFLELSDQKPDGSQREGFDHIEVYPLPPLTYSDMITRLSAAHEVVHVECPHHTTDDVALPSGFIFRATTEPLVRKIAGSEMIAGI